MSQQIINQVSAGDTLGDPIFTAFGKVNANDTELYSAKSQTVSVYAFGAVGDGVTDDTAAFTAAMASLGGLGGTAVYNKRHYIAGPLTLPQNVTLKGPFSLVGGPNSVGPVSYGVMAALVLNTANPIFVGTGSGTDGALIIPQGMSWPQTASTSWVGTAVQIQGDNSFVINSMILGFNQAILSGPTCTFTGAINNGSGGAGTILAASAVTGKILPGMVLYSNVSAPFGGTSILAQLSGPAGGAGNYTVTISQNYASNSLIGGIGQGTKLFNTKIDCVNGVLLQNPQDNAHCFNVECFPYATISAVTKPANWADRGSAFQVLTSFAGSGASCSFYDCFSYGYLNGFTLNATNDSVLDGCWADGNNALANSIGFNVIGGFGGAENKLTACVTTGVQTGFFINNNVGTETMLVHATCTANEVSAVSGVNKSIWVNSGDAYIIGAAIRGSGSGGSGGFTNHAVYISSAVSRVIVEGLRSQGLNGLYPPIYNSSATPYLFLGINDFRDFNLGNSPVFQYVPQTIVSAGAVTTLPLTGDTFFVSGTTQIGSIGGGYPGRRIRLIFQSACPVFHGGVAPAGIALLGNTTTTFPAGSMLELTYQLTSGYSGLWTQSSPSPLLSTGWGTPTGGAVVTNFPGATATLLQTSTAVAQLIALLKQYGALGV